MGLDIEIARLIAEGLGVEARFEEPVWDAILPGVDSGRYDIACNGVGYTEKRAESYYFSTPYVYTQKVLVVSKDNEDIKTVEDLKGKTTANSSSSTYAALAEAYGATVEPVDTLGETVTLLRQGRVDATINARVSIEDYLKQQPDAPIKIVQVLPGDPVAYPFSMSEKVNAASLVEAVNEILEQARQDGRLAAISVKYFSCVKMRPGVEGITGPMCTATARTPSASTYMTVLSRGRPSSLLPSTQGWVRSM